MQFLTMPLEDVTLTLLEKLGLAWWIEVTTTAPHCTYYFGPFATKSEAESHQSGYLEDLGDEGATGITANIKRCQPKELTILWEERPAESLKPAPPPTNTPPSRAPNSPRIPQN